MYNVLNCDTQPGHPMLHFAVLLGTLICLNSHSKFITVQRETCMGHCFCHCYPGTECTWKTLFLILSNECYNVKTCTYFFKYRFCVVSQKEKEKK